MKEGGTIEQVIRKLAQQKLKKELELLGLRGIEFESENHRLKNSKNQQHHDKRGEPQEKKFYQKRHEQETYENEEHQPKGRQKYIQKKLSKNYEDDNLAQYQQYLDEQSQTKSQTNRLNSSNFFRKLSQEVSQISVNEVEYSSESQISVSYDQKLSEKRPHRNNRNERFLQRKNDQNYTSDRFTRKSEKLNENEEQLGIWVKKLKKFFLESEPIRCLNQKPSQITVMKSLQAPVIFLSYSLRNQKKIMHMRQIERGLSDRSKLGDLCQVVKNIYDMFYLPVDIQFEDDLLQFAKIKADKVRIKLALNQRKNRREKLKQTETLFYYWINQDNSIEFVFFDYVMKNVTFGEKDVNQEKKKVSPQVLNTFDKFKRAVLGKQQELNITKMIDEEVESDQQTSRKPHFADVTIQWSKVKNSLEEIIHFDTYNLEDQIDDKVEEQLDLIQQASPDTNKIEKLGELIERMNLNLENFKDVKNSVEAEFKRIKLENSYSQENLEILKLLLKRMIFAKKQLDSDLPILGKKKEIFDLLDKNNLIILEGETGSGKSTQLPQMLCEYYKLFENPKALPVLVTQPRKIATRSLAERVADELEERGGTFVDYVASGTKVANPKAKIIFKLDRLVLDELVESPTLDAYSCLVIDEAHERTISIDVILGLVKELLKKRDGFKVIITSASMEISLFERYFKMKTLKVSGRMYPVNIKYLPSKEEDMVRKIEKAIDSELLTERNMLKDKYKGHILVFCADTAEIEALSEIFRKKLNHNVFMVIPLHGKLTPEDQKKAFSKTKEHKLIFASRIAETAITIDGVKVVIDPGWDREMQYDQKTKFSSMKLAQISQSSAKQRAGRAGRTQEGYCLRLYSEEEFNRRRFNKLPEIKNIALETLVLRLKTLGINNVSSFDYIERPDEEGMKTSIETLKMIGCLDGKEIITSIGRFLVKIPIEPFLARAIIEGLLMQKVLELQNSKNSNSKSKNSYITESIIEILCMVLSAGNLFRIQENFRELGEYVKYKHFSHQKGDFFFLRNVYDTFMSICQSRKQELNDWLKSCFLIRKTLMQVKDLVKEIMLIVNQFHIDEREMKEDMRKCRLKLHKYKKEQDRILSCLTTSFAANLCLYSGHAQVGYTYMSMQKVVNIYGTSCLSLLGICPKWILAYEFYENKDGRLYCKVANAIDYEFMHNTVQDYVFEKYQIKKLQDHNPFYKQVNYELETLTMVRVKELYERRFYMNKKQQQQYCFLKHINLAFSQTENKITAFIQSRQPTQQNSQTIKSFQTQFQHFIASIKQKALNAYNHNYIGNIYVMIKNGFQIENILFKNTQTLFQIGELDDDMFDTIYNDWCYHAYIETFGKRRMKLYFDDEDLIVNFQSYISWYTNVPDKKITVRTEIADTRKKIPQTKIYLHWYAGRQSKQNILIMYGTEKNRNPNNKEAYEQLIKDTTMRYDQINQAYLELRYKWRQNDRPQRTRRRRDNRDPDHDNDDRNQGISLSQDIRKIAQQTMDIHSIRLTKKLTGINIFSSELDEIDLIQWLNQAIVTNSISPSFELPTSIKKFRDYERPQCEWKDEVWVEKIQQMLETVTDKHEPCIRVWGYRIRPKEGEQLSDFQKTFRVQMKAEIKTLDSQLFNKLKRQYDGQKGILGYEKLHVTSVFTQSIIGVDSRVFQCLYEEFMHNCDEFKLQYPGILIECDQRPIRRFDKRTKVFINVSSENRQHLMKPTRVLNTLFTPKYITLLDSQFRFLNKNQGNDMLQNIEADFQYQIYFGFDKYQRRLKLYCHQSLEEEVKFALKDELLKIKYHDEVISYKGRNLKKIEAILKDEIIEIEYWNRKRKRANQKFLQYEIKFSFRQIKLLADIDTLNDIRLKIMNIKLEENQKNCQICNEIMLAPYKLFNCGHSFCWFCLQNVIKEFKLGQSSQLVCSFYLEKERKPCAKLINIYDVMRILSEQELQQIFDVKISKFVDAHSNRYIRCFSPDCEQIFQRQSLKYDSQIDCRLCGKCYCLKCKESHKNYTCEEWRHRFYMTEKLMERIGIKQCPNCQIGIQKNGGCMHISCKCGAHICWKCGKSFLSQKQCEDHLVQKHAGIFGDDYIESQDW